MGPNNLWGPTYDAGHEWRRTPMIFASWSSRYETYHARKRQASTVPTSRTLPFMITARNLRSIFVWSKKCASLDILRGNFSIAGGLEVSAYTSHSLSSRLKLKFTCSFLLGRLDSSEKSTGFSFVKHFEIAKNLFFKQLQHELQLRKWRRIIHERKPPPLGWSGVRSDIL